jgi:adenosylhomocysteine nucleosidase
MDDLRCTMYDFRGAISDFRFLERERRFFKMVMIRTYHNHHEHLRSPFAFHTSYIVLTFTPMTRIGIMGALPEEINGITQLMEDLNSQTIGRRIFYTGTINGTSVVVVYSRMGKVAAATTVSVLVHWFKVTEVIFTGVAGALSPDLIIGDMIVATELLQHDMDARPLFPRYEIPLLRKTWFSSDKQRSQQITRSIENLLQEKVLHQLIAPEVLEPFGINSPKLMTGAVISGDQFINSEAHKKQLLEEHPQALCVEMEGAAVAQVCYENDIPFTIIRTISDTADEKASVDFNAFVREVASRYSVAVIQSLF